MTTKGTDHIKQKEERTELLKSSQNLAQILPMGFSYRQDDLLPSHSGWGSEKDHRMRSLTGGPCRNILLSQLWNGDNDSRYPIKLKLLKHEKHLEQCLIYKCQPLLFSGFRFFNEKIKGQVSCHVWVSGMNILWFSDTPVMLPCLLPLTFLCICEPQPIALLMSVWGRENYTNGR